jgi:BirA family biotin operon repressor/biotin-[acetyl-CoA-carboxylase] ligase
MNELHIELHTAESVKSTNTALKELAKNGAPEGYLLSASAQTRGRGRLNRVFFSPQGTGLYCSLLLRPEIVLPPYALTCMTAVALCETIESYGITCGIKWVNDIYVNGKKSAGILVESAIEQNGVIRYAVVGIGVNLFYPIEGFPEELRDKAGSVFSSVPNEDLKHQFLKRLMHRIKSYYSELPEITYRDAYRSRLILLGKEILFSDAAGMQNGIVVGLDDAFRLSVRTASGDVRSLDRGDVTML